MSSPLFNPLDSKKNIISIALPNSISIVTSSNTGKLIATHDNGIDEVEIFESITSLALDQNNLIYTKENGLEDITGIEKLISLKSLRFLSKSISSKQYNSLSDLVNLESLDLSGNANFKNTKSLTNLNFIKDLNLSECQFIKHVDGLRNMINLKNLNLDGCGRLENIDGL